MVEDRGESKRILQRSSMVGLALLCFLALVADGGQKGRVMALPTYFLTAEKFLDLKEFERIYYITGVMDGFYGGAYFGATDDAISSLKACTKSVDAKQVTAIISKYVADHPEAWHLPLSMQAFNALNNACPNVLK